MSAAERLRGRTYENITANAGLSPYIANVYPLTGQNLQLNRRTKVDSLGEGGFGSVNLERVNRGARVATKYSLQSYFNPGEGSQYDETLRANLTEVAMLKYLKGYPSVAQYIDVVEKKPGSAEPLPFPGIVMAIAKGSIASLELTSWRECFQAVVGVLHGFHVLHSLRITHNDMKPENALITAYDEIWLTDFGASTYTQPYFPAMQGRVISNRVSPETKLRPSFSPTGKEYGMKCDAWSVGVSLINILTVKDFCYSVFGTVNNYISKICSTLGTFQEEDGATFTLFESYMKSKSSSPVEQTKREQLLAAYSLYPSRVESSIEAIFNIDLLPEALRPTTEEERQQFERIKRVLNGLLDYNPTKRPAFSTALEMATGLPAPPIVPRPLVSVAAFPAVAAVAAEGAELDRAIREISLTQRKDKELRMGSYFSLGFISDVKARAIVFDRAAWYMTTFLKENEKDLDEIALLPSAALIVASNLFNSNAPAFCPAFLLDATWENTYSKVDSEHDTEQAKRNKAAARRADPSIEEKIRSIASLYKLINEIVQVIPLLGTTVLDELHEGATTLDPALAFLNYTCHRKGLYGKYRDRKEALKTCMKAVAAEGGPSEGFLGFFEAPEEPADADAEVTRCAALLDAKMAAVAGGKHRRPTRSTRSSRVRRSSRRRRH